MRSKKRFSPMRIVRSQALRFEGRLVRRLAAQLLKTPVFTGSHDVAVASTAVINDALFNTQSGPIVVEEWAFFGHRVSLLTGTHMVEVFDLDRQQAIPADGRGIRIGRGAWIGSGVTIVGPCVVGDHAVVGSGAVVLRDVEPFTIVAGVPAREIGRISTRPSSVGVPGSTDPA